MNINTDIKSIINKLKSKTKNSNGFYYSIVAHKQKDDIIDFLRAYYKNVILEKPNIYTFLYYNNYSSDYQTPKCPICNDDCKYRGKGLEFIKTCGKSECNKKLRKQTNIKRYGVDYVIKNSSVANKMKNTIKERYGVEHYSQTNEYKEKYKQTNLKRYGVENPLLDSIIQEKIKQTNLKRYGVENVFSSNIIKEKIKQTNLEKYNVENYKQSEEGKKRFKEYSLKKYGVENPFSSNIIKEKIKQTNLEKYGVEYSSQSDVCKKQSKQTNLEKYGVEYYSQTDKWKNKINTNNTNNRIKRINNIIKKKSLNLILNDDICFCKKCEQTFNIREQFIQERFRYFPEIVCPYCNPKGEKQTSQGEQELLSFIKDLIPNEKIYNRYSDIYKGKKHEIDIYIPSMKIGFEFNGLYWHNELHKDKYYHRDKSKLTSEKGIRLIHVWEDDWIYKTDIVKSRIRNILNKTENRIYARNTKISNINYQDCKQFLDENHIQGCGVGNIRYGLFYKDELVSVIQIDSSGQLSRFANKLNTNVIGGFSKLFNHTKEYIKYTFIDLDWSSENNIYNKFMKFDSYIEPTWYLIYEGRRVHRRNFQKKKLLQMGLGSPEQTEHEITLNNKLYRIYNSGNIKYVKQIP